MCEYGACKLNKKEYVYTVIQKEIGLRVCLLSFKLTSVELRIHWLREYIPTFVILAIWGVLTPTVTVHIFWHLIFS